MRGFARTALALLGLIFILALVIGVFTSEAEKINQPPFLVAFGALVGIVVVVLGAAMVPEGQGRPRK